MLEFNLLVSKSKILQGIRASMSESPGAVIKLCFQICACAPLRALASSLCVRPATP